MDTNTNYEEKIGYDYDIVFCMSLIHWVKDKNRLMRYLSNFNHVIFEGHESNSVEIAQFKKYGFDKYAILGNADKERTIILFSK